MAPPNGKEIRPQLSNVPCPTVPPTIIWGNEILLPVSVTPSSSMTILPNDVTTLLMANNDMTQSVHPINAPVPTILTPGLAHINAPATLSFQTVMPGSLKLNKRFQEPLFVMTRVSETRLNAPSAGNVSNSSSTKSLYDHFQCWKTYKNLVRAYLPGYADTEVLACFMIPVLRSLKRHHPDVNIKKAVRYTVKEWLKTSESDRKLFNDMAKMFKQFEMQRCNDQTPQSEDTSESQLLKYIESLCDQPDFLSQVEEIIHPAFLEAILSADTDIDLQRLHEKLEKEENFSSSKFTENRQMKSEVNKLGTDQQKDQQQCNNVVIQNGYIPIKPLDNGVLANDNKPRLTNDTSEPNLKRKRKMNHCRKQDDLLERTDTSVMSTRLSHFSPSEYRPCSSEHGQLNGDRKQKKQQKRKRRFTAGDAESTMVSLQPIVLLHRLPPSLLADLTSD